jgi:hypothetical protein
VCRDHGGHVSALDARERAQTKVELVVNLKAAKTLGVNDHAVGAAEQRHAHLRRND